jgi:predicted membrane protein
MTTPEKKRMPIEQIGLRVITYGQAALTAIVCIVLAFIILQYHLLPNLFYRIIAIVFLLALVVIYVPRSIKEVFDEVKRRG